MNSITTSSAALWRDDPRERNCGIRKPGAHREFMPRQLRPDIYSINDRQERVAIDQKIRYGKELVVRRSDFSDWNYDAELSAFQARIGERFDDRKLRQAFVTLGYLESEQLKARELGIKKDEAGSELEEESLVLTTAEVDKLREGSNVPMAAEGQEVLESVLSGYARAALPHLPEEGVMAVVGFLTDDKTLAHVSFHVGTKDVVLSTEYPPSTETMANVMRAIVAALWNSGQERAKLLIVDVVGTQLHGRDINDIWDVENPVAVVARLMANQGLPEPESRMLWVSGEATMMACFHVGVYCDKELVGQAPGETAEIAEEMAARDVLRNMFGYRDAADPLPFTRELSSNRTHELRLKTGRNARLDEWTPDNVVVCKGQA